MAGAARSSRTLRILLGGLVAAGCAPNALVALPSSSARWIDDTAAAATKARVTVEARTSGWPEPPHVELGARATPLFVRVDNDGTVPLRIARSAFELVTGTKRFRTMPPEDARAPSDAPELPSMTLAPGASVSGFLFFEPVIGDWGFVTLRTMLIDAGDQALLETIDVPFASGRRCTPRARGQPADHQRWLFRMCTS